MKLTVKECASDIGEVPMLVAVDGGDTDFDLKFVYPALWGTELEKQREFLEELALRFNSLEGS